MKTLQTLTLSLLLLSLSACGFHLRGQENMPFSSVYIDAANPNSELVRDLRRRFDEQQITLVKQPQQADIILNISSEANDKQILSLSGSGRVNEFNLRYRVSLYAYDQQKNTWLPADEIRLQRTLTYDDSRILAKEGEETMLIQSMRQDMAQQILRRLSRAKPVAEK